MRKKDLFYILYIIFVLSITTLISFSLLKKKSVFFTGLLALKKNKSILEKHFFYNFDNLSNFFGLDKVQKEKPSNIFRIIALGDSFTAGVGVKRNETWPKQLEKKLNNLNLSFKFEVLNMGVGGFGTYEELMVFKNIGLKFDPDMVILQYYLRDWTSPEIRGRANELWEEYKRTKKLPKEIEKSFKKLNISIQALRNFIFNYLTFSYLESKGREWEKEWDRWTKPSLLELIKICREKDIQLIIIGWDFELFPQEREKLAALLKNYDIPFYDFSKILPPPPMNCSSSPTRLPDCHLNPTGYKIVADKLVDIVMRKVS